MGFLECVFQFDNSTHYYQFNREKINEKLMLDPSIGLVSKGSFLSIRVEKG